MNKITLLTCILMVCGLTSSTFGQTAPSFTDCPVAPITQNNDPSVCGAVVTFATPTATDPDGAETPTVSQSAGLASGSTFPVGDTLIEFEATDSDGTTICSFTITVLDAESPVANCVAPFSLALNGDGTVSITPVDIDNGSTDNCGIDSLALDITDFTCANLGDNIVTLTVVDAQGNSDTCSTTITITEDALDLQCPADITLNLSDVITTIIPNNATTSFTTVFGSSLTNSFNGLGLSTFPSLDGTHDGSTPSNSWIGSGSSGTITYNLGGEQSVSSLYLWNQNGGGPGANGTSGIQDVIISSSTDGTNFTPIPGAPSTFSQVTGDSALSPEVFTFSPINASSIRIEVLSNYGDGNTGIAEIAFSSVTPGCGAIVDYTLEVLNNCAGDATITQTAGFASGNPFPVGTTTNTFEVADGSGGFNTCSFNITIIDDVAPEMVCQDITVQLDNTGSVTILPEDIDNGSFDNCGSITLTLNIDTFTCAEVGENTVTLIGEDADGNMASCQAIVTVENTIEPTAICQDITIQLDNVGSASITASDIDNGSTVNCGSPILSIDVMDFTCANVGENTVTLTVTDDNGATATCEATVTVEENALTTLICPADIILNLSDVATPITPISASTTFTTAFGTSLDNGFDGTGLDTFPSLTSDHAPSSTANSWIGEGTSGMIDFNLGGEQTISGFSFWNQNGGGPGPNGTSGIQDVIVSSSTDGTNFTPIPGSPTTFAQVMANAASPPEIFSFNPIVASTIRLEIINNYGDGNVAFAEIVFSDDTPGCGAIVDYQGPFTDASCDNNAGIVQTAGFPSGSAFPIGTTTNTFEVPDGLGGTFTCSFDVTITDDVAPDALCQDITVELDASGNATITTADIDNGTTDNCGTANLALDITSFTCAELGENIVTLTATDDNGNTSSCQAIVTVTSSELPVAVCQDITIQLVAGVATITPADVDNGSGSTCGATADLSIDISEFTCENLGPNTVTLTVTDASGNTDTCEAIVTVENNEPLEITCPSDITINLSDVATPITPTSASTTFTTAFGTSLNNAFNGTGLDTFPSLTSDHAPSATTNSWIGEGTTGTIDFSLGGETTVSGIAFWNQNGGGPGPNGTSGIQDVIVSSSTDGTNFTPIPGAPTTFAQVTANAASAPETFLFTPVQASTIRIEVLSNYGDGNTAFAEIAFSDTTTGCGAIVNYEGPFSNEECLGGGTLTQTSGFPSGSAFPIGITTNTFEVTAGGVTENCSFTVTILDDVAPDVLCQDITVELDVSGNATITTADIDNGTTDNCGTANLALDITSFTCAELGENIVTLTATDDNGNTSSCQAIVTVTSSELPVAVCQDITIQLVAGVATITPADVDNGSGSTCGATADLSIDISEFTCENLGPNTVTLTVTDASGNTDTCEAIVTVENNEPLEITCPSDITINLSDVLTPVVPQSSSTSFNTAFGSDLSNMFNGSGLDTFPSVTASHDPTNPSNSWIGEGSTGTIDFNLDGEQTIKGFSIWNQNGGGPGLDGTSGIDKISISYSIDGINFTQIPGAPSTIAQVTDNMPVAPETFAFDPVTASIIRFEILSNHGDGNTGIGEIVFVDATPGCGAIVFYEGPFSNEDCLGGGTLTQTAGFPSGNPFPVGTTTNTFEVTDVNGTTVTCSFDITIIEDVAPIVLCQDITIQLDETGNASILIEDIDGGTTDNCGDFTLALDIDTFDCTNIGENTVTLTATDASGNIASCTAIVTVENLVIPEAVCQNITLELDVNGIGILDPALLDGGSTLNCGIPTFTTDITEFTCENLGENTVILTVTDEQGNSDTCEAIVTVVNNQPVSITCPDDIIINLSEVATVISPIGASSTFTNAFGSELNTTFNGNGLEVFPSTTSNHEATTTANSWIGQGITGSIDFDFGGTQTISGLSFWNQNGGGPGVDGTSGIQGVQFSYSTNGIDFIVIPDAPTTFAQAVINGLNAPEIFEFTPIMATAVRMEILSNYGDGNSAFAEIAFSDNTPGCGAIVTYEGPLTNASCDGGGELIQTAGFASGSPFPVGTTTNTFEVTDGAGNVQTCSFDVTIIDDVAPRAVCQDITLQLDDTGSITITPEDIDGGSFDNCGDITLAIDLDTFTCDNIGENIVTLTVTDQNGLAATCEAIVTIDANNPPQAVCQDITVFVDADGTAIITPTDVDGGSFSSCGTFELSIDVDTFTCENLGENTVVLTATNEAGESTTCEAIVTVENTNPLTIECPEDITINLSDVLTPISPTSFNSTFTDAFGSSLVNTINGEGLEMFPSATANHEATTTANSWIGQGVTGSIDFDFGGTQTISGLSFWNQNGGGPGVDGTSGIQDVAFSYSTNGIDFMPVPDAPTTFAQANTNGLNAPETFEFTPIDAAVIRMEVISNYGDGNVAFAEIVFVNNTPGCGAVVTYEGPFSNVECLGGGELIQSSGFASGSPFPVGTTTNIFEVTDVNGTTVTCSFDVTIIDDVAPRAICQDITLQLDDTGSITITPEDIDGGSFDNCGDITLAIDLDTFTCDNIGENIVTLTVTDQNGLTATCEAIVTIDANNPPQAVCQDITVFVDADGVATITPADVDGGSFSSCGTFELSIDVDTFTCENLGENTVILTATNEAGESTTCEAIVTVENTNPLMIECPEDITINLSDVLTPVTISSATSTFTDAFGTNLTNAIDGTGLEMAPSTTANHEATTTANSWIGEGITGSIDFDFGSLQTISALSFWNQNGGGPGPDGTSGIEKVAFSYSTDGTNFIGIPDAPATFAQIMSNGLNGPETFEFTPIEATTIRLQILSNYGDGNSAFAEIVFANNTPGCGAIVTYEGPFSNVECLGGGELIQTAGFASGSPFPVGTTTNTFEVTDVNGTTVSCSFDVTVVDDVAPVMMCNELTIQLDENGFASITLEDVDGGSFDNCGTLTLDIDITDFTCDNVGENIVTITGTDSNGNTATCQALVTVENLIIPEAVCQNITVELDANGVIVLDPSLLDGGSTVNCGTPIFTTDITEFNCENLGENTVILTVTDEQGNSATCEAIVTVVNNQPISITCPEDIILNLSDVTDAILPVSASSSFANAFGSSLENSFNGSGLEAFPSTVGSHEASTPANSWIGTGSSGTIDYDLGELTLLSGLAVWNQNGGGPGLGGTSGVQNVQLFASLDGIEYTEVTDGPTVFAQVATDSPTGPETFNFAQIEAQFMRLEILSNYGDGNTGIAEIAFTDPTAGCGAIVAYEGPLTNTICVGGGEVIQTVGFASGSPFPLGTTTNTFEVTDGAGNTQTCSFDITIIDDVAPRAVCQDIIITLDENGEATILPSDIDGGSTDNCGDITLSIDIDTFTCDNLGENTVVLTVTDNQGFTSTCEAIVTIESDIPPTAVCQDITVELDENGLVTITPEDIDGGSFAICNEVILEVDILEFGCENIGENTVVLTVTDENGSTSTCEAIVTVINNQPITITCPEDIVLNLSEVNSPLIPSGATSSFVPGFGSELINTINGEGLTMFPSLSAEHAATDATNSFIGQGSSGTLEFEFNEAQSISGFSFWNQNGGGPGPDGTSGIQDVLISYSENGTDYIEIPGAPNTFAQANINGLNAPETFEFDPVNAIAIRIEVLSNYGDGNTAFAEIAFSDNAPGCGSIVTYEQPISNENCVGGGTVTQTAGFPSGNPFPVGTTTNTFEVEDQNGNISTCSFTVTIVDDVAPIMVCESITVALDEDGNATITPEDVDGGTADNCTSITLSIDVDTFTCENIGENIVILTATDENGNTSSCEATVTIVNEVPPTLTCQNITVELDENGLATITGNDVLDATATPCLIDSVELDVDTFSCDSLGPNTVTVTVTDNSGNSASCEAIVTVVDAMAPMLECQDATISLDENGVATVTPEDVIVTLVAVGGIPFEGNNTPQSVPPAGTGGVNCADGPTESTAVSELEGILGTDYNIASVTVNLTHSFVGDVELTLTSPEGTELLLASNNGGDGDGYFNTSFEDDGADINSAAAPFTGIYVPEGGTFADTFAGQVSNGNWVLSVCDNANGDTGELLDFEISFTNPEDDLLGVPDNCEATALIEFDIDTWDCTQLGEQTITITATDAKGNVATCTTTVTVVDEAAPTVLCENITIALDDTGVATITAEEVDGGSFDNCDDDLTLSIDQTDFGCEDIGPNTVILTVTDSNGNTATCEAIVTVTNEDFPIIGCQDDFTVVADLNNLFVIEDFIASLTDNCTGATYDNVTQAPVPGTVIDAPAIIPVTLTGVDSNGSEVSCTFEITVESNPLSVDDISLRETDILLYPNPTESIITLRNDSFTPLDKVQMTDIRGRIIETIDLSTMGAEREIDMTNYASGIYFAHISAGDITIIKRVIKRS